MSILRLAMTCFLAVGTLGLGALAGFPASSRASGGPSRDPVSYVSYRDLGDTVYHVNSGKYDIHNWTPDSSNQAVVVKFFCEKKNPCPIDGNLHVCRNGQDVDCHGTMLQKIDGRLCMKTGIADATHEKGYQFGPDVCFDQALPGGA